MTALSPSSVADARMSTLDPFGTVAGGSFRSLEATVLPLANY
jgi:hypothetical protein